MTVFKPRANERGGGQREYCEKKGIPPLSPLRPKSQLNQIADQASMVTRARNCFGCIAVKESINVLGFLLV